MPKITKFDKATCITFRRDLEAHLKPFLEARGLSLDLGNARFDGASVRFINSTFKTTGEDSLAVKQERDALIRALQMHGHVKFGTEPKLSNGRGMTLVSYRPKAFKKPWVFTKDSEPGKQFILPDELLSVYFPQG